MQLTRLSKLLFVFFLSCFLLIVTNNASVIGLDVNNLEDNVGPANSVWTSISSEFILNHYTQSDKVQTEIRKLVADKDNFERILRAATPYISFIHNQTKAKGLPAEIALIPFIESEFNPNDHSKKGALGLWQLMSGTATELGVKVKASYDGRRNVIASTKAALAYFKDLGNDFHGDWYLAIAAYNCGQGKVESVKKRTGQNDFWNLPLPQETKLYVPRLLAVAEIISNPKKYGIELPEISNEPYFAVMKADKPIDLESAAKTADINIKTLQSLNPDAKKAGGVVQKEGSLLVPTEKVKEVQTKLDVHPA